MTSKVPHGIRVSMQEAYITREEVERIVAEKVKEALEEFVRKGEEKIKELSLIERIVKVEEELKALREIEQARFEAAERRFEALQREMDTRFSSLERRLNFTQWIIVIGFTLLGTLITVANFLKSLNSTSAS